MSSLRSPQDRRISFASVFNVRDLGGLPTADGDRIRRGLVFRADGVHRLAGDDLDIARRLGLRTVIDLRTTNEIDRGPQFPAAELGVEWHHLPVIPRQWSEDALVAAATATEFLTERYLEMLEVGGASIARSLELIAHRGPTLFHCAAGKDRTGVLAATVLGLAGVDNDVIAADYHLSSVGMAEMMEWLLREHPEARDAMVSQPREYFECPAEAMLGFLAGVREQYGTMSDLARALGVDDDTVDLLRATLVEPAGLAATG
jgi:protein-tyrosine phosphatase